MTAPPMWIEVSRVHLHVSPRACAHLCVHVCVCVLGDATGKGSRDTFARPTLGAHVGFVVPRALVFCYLINFG